MNTQSDLTRPLFAVVEQRRNADLRPGQPSALSKWRPNPSVTCLPDCLEAPDPTETTDDNGAGHTSSPSSPLSPQHPRCEPEERHGNIQALTAFLFEHRMGHVAKAWLPSLPPNVEPLRQSLVAQAYCLVDERNWGALIRLVAEQSWGEADYLRHALSARAWRELENDTEADHSWIAALQAASRNPQDFARLARLADEWGWLAEHDQALWCVVRRFPSEQWALECLTRTYAARRDTPGLHQVNTIWAARCPDEPVAKNELAKTSLLLEIRPDHAHSLAWQAYASNPRNASFATTYAWSLHRQGHTVDGILVLKDLDTDQLDDPLVALYFGAMLAAGAIKDLARRYLDIAARGSLLSEEREILAEATARL